MVANRTPITSGSEEPSLKHAQPECSVITPTKSCASCSLGCLTCSSPNNCSSCDQASGFSSVGGACTCPNGSYDFLGRSCIEDCPQGYYEFTNGSNTCVECPSNCISCRSSTNCLKCTNSYSLLKNSSTTGECVVYCPSAYYHDTKQFLCLPCLDNCETCTNSEERTCTKCHSGFFLNTKENKCV